MQSEIEATAIALSSWRNGAGSSAAAVPVELQQRVVKLLETHTWAAVIARVGISKARLAAWRQRHRAALGLARRVPQRQRRVRGVGSPPSDPTFVELPVTTAALSHDFDFELQLPSGLVLRARAACNAPAVAEVLCRLITAVGAAP